MFSQDTSNAKTMPRSKPLPDKDRLTDQEIKDLTLPITPTEQADIM